MKKILIILVLTIIGGMLRIYNLSSNPIGLNVDEVSIGYNAYSILKTGKDEYGNFLPLTFRSLGDYKPPFYIYLTVPSIALFGLNEFSIRLPSALFSTFLIPFFYLFLLKLINNKGIAMVGTILLSISPWHIYFGRIASETSVATVLTVIGIYCLIKIEKGNIFWPLISAFFLALSMYTYHTQRLFVPLFVLAFIFYKWKNIRINKKKIIIFLITLFVFLIPLFFTLIIGSDTTRAKMTLISNDINFKRYIFFSSPIVLSGNIDNVINLLSNNNFLMFFHWLRKYLAYLQPSFLFYDGLDMTLNGTYGLGVMYLFEVPFLILGVISLLRKKIENKAIIFLWILIGILPASLTLSERQPFRTMVILPMLILISAIGAVTFFDILKKIKSFYKLAIILFSGLFIVLNLLQAFLIYFVHFPTQRGEYFMEGNKEAVDYVLKNKDKYKEIVFDPYRGTEGPFTVTVPHMYILFYSKYDPRIYQSEDKIQEDGSFKFNKYTVREIYWPKDRNERGVLFVGTPWHLPNADLEDADVLERIYLKNGNIVYTIVAPRDK